jgi:hypothetical protein
MKFHFLPVPFGAGCYNTGTNEHFFIVMGLVKVCSFMQEVEVGF